MYAIFSLAVLFMGYTGTFYVTSMESIFCGFGSGTTAPRALTLRAIFNRHSIFFAVFGNAAFIYVIEPKKVLR